MLVILDAKCVVKTCYIGDDIFELKEVQENQSLILDEVNIEIGSSENIVDEFSAEVIVENNQSLESPSLIIDSTLNEIISTEINNEINSEIENINRESAISDEANIELSSSANDVNILESEDELLGVLSHEISHFVGDHHINNIIEFCRL